MKKNLILFLSVFLLGCSKNSVVLSTLSREWVSDGWEYTLENRTLNGDTLSMFSCGRNYCFLLQGGVCSLEYIPDDNNWRVSIFCNGEKEIVNDRIKATEVQPVPIYTNTLQHVVLRTWDNEGGNFDTFKVIDLKKKGETTVTVSDKYVSPTERTPGLCFAYFKSLDDGEEIRVVDMEKGEVTVCAKSKDLMIFSTEEFVRRRIEWKDSSSFVFCVRNTDTDFLTFYLYDYITGKTEKMLEVSNPPVDFSLEHFSFSFHNKDLYLLGDEGIFLKKRRGFAQVLYSENLIDFIFFHN